MFKNLTIVKYFILFTYMFILYICFFRQQLFDCFFPDFVSRDRDPYSDTFSFHEFLFMAFGRDADLMLVLILI